jgi:hypothetical protein
VIYPTHGPEFTDPERDIARYLEHRAARERQVLEAVAAGARGVEEIAARVYGAVDPALEEWVGATTRAYLEHLERTGRIGEAWQQTPER